MVYTCVCLGAELATGTSRSGPDSWGVVDSVALVDPVKCYNEREDRIPALKA